MHKGLIDVIYTKYEAGIPPPIEKALTTPPPTLNIIKFLILFKYTILLSLGTILQ